MTLISHHLFILNNIPHSVFYVVILVTIPIFLLVNQPPSMTRPSADLFHWQPRSAASYTPSPF